MAKKAFRKVAIALWLGGFGLANLALAQGILPGPPPSSGGGGGSGVTLTNPLGANSSFTTVIQTILKVLITVAVPLTAIMAIIGAFQMITSAGNPEAFSKGRKTLLYAAIGFAVVLLAGSIVTIITNLLKGNTQ